MSHWERGDIDADRLCARAWLGHGEEIRSSSASVYLQHAIAVERRVQTRCQGGGVNGSGGDATRRGACGVSQATAGCGGACSDGVRELPGVRSLYESRLCSKFADISQVKIRQRVSDAGMLMTIFGEGSMRYGASALRT